MRICYVHEKHKLINKNNVNTFVTRACVCLFVRARRGWGATFCCFWSIMFRNVLDWEHSTELSCTIILFFF